jgi:uncharacterized membrane protein
VSERALRWAASGLAGAGLGIAAYLTYTRYADAAIACSTGGCETVQSSEYATLAGIPVPVLGLVGYAAILATALVRGEIAALAGAALALGGFAFSIYLVYVQWAIIEAFCLWCLASDVVMFLLVMVTLLRVRASSRTAVGTVVRPPPARTSSPPR